MAEDLDPNKYHVFSPAQKRNILMLLILVGLLVIPSLSFVYYRFAINRPAQNSNETTFEISRGQGVREVATLLKEKNLINSEFLFNLYVLTHKMDKDIQAGVFTVPAGVPLVELVQYIKHGTNDVRLTLLEGWRVEEYAREASQKFKNVDYEEFISLAKPHEGFLFPDTYMFNSEVSEEQIVEALRQNYTDKTKDLLTSSQLSKIDLTEQEVITVASILEREVSHEDDLPVVAGILLKRWRNGEIVGADATTQYAVALSKFCAPGIPLSCFDGSRDCPISSDVQNCLDKSGATTADRILAINWWPHELTQEDLDFDSKYNTRKNGGLTPTPISNPGKRSIQAVLNATKTEYNFYLNDADGNTHYARTLAEHNSNIANYLR